MTASLIGFAVFLWFISYKAKSQVNLVWERKCDANYGAMTGIGGGERSYNFNVSFFKNYLTASELQIMQQTILNKVNELRVFLGLNTVDLDSK